MKRKEANLKIVDVLKTIPEVRDLQFWDNFGNVYLLPDLFREFADKYPQQRAGQIFCNYICPDYRLKEVSAKTEQIINTLFNIDYDPFYEESVDTLKRLQK